jgi:hypothetical protein
MKRFDKQKRHDIKNLRETLDQEKSKMKEKQNMVERKASLRLVQTIEKQIENILSEKEYKTYLDKIKPLLDEYNVIGTLSRVVSFASKKDESDSDEEVPEDTDTQIKRHQLIYDFLEIARKYIEIDLVREVKEGNICSCGFRLDDIETDVEENGLVTCPNCFTERISVVRSRFYKDNMRTNNSGNNYQDRENFGKVLMRYQGKQPDKPGRDLYICLEEYFVKNELPKIDIHNDGKPQYVTSDYIKNHMPLNEDGEKDGTSRPLMYKALKDTDNTNYYDHINIILHEVWGWKLDNISHLEDRIMDDYDISQRVYEILPKDRKSSLNSQFRLFKHLRRLGHPCKVKNFRIPTTHDILEFHRNMWDKICKILGWENL